MSIPLSKLETWSNPGATTISSASYNSIRTALFKTGSPVDVPAEDVFLQGSYGNSTNIYGDSDVDVIVLYKKTFHKDMSALSASDQLRHEATFPPATYLWTNLRDDVLTALRAHFGHSTVTLGKKSIKVKMGTGRMTADVVPVVEFRQYATFVDRNTLTAHWGVAFNDNAGNQITNYPKNHIERGESKNSAERTGGKYKKTIRIFKNFRNHMVDRGHIEDKNIAPSYFIECLLHNVPDTLFLGDFSETVPTIIKHLLTTPYGGFMCQNGITKLFGETTTQWQENNYVTFITAAQKAWDEYYA